MVNCAQQTNLAPTKSTEKITLGGPHSVLHTGKVQVDSNVVIVHYNNMFITTGGTIIMESGGREHMKQTVIDYITVVYNCVSVN